MRIYRHDLTQGHNQTTYMKRWIFECRWFSIRLHNILRADAERTWHSHPWWFVSLILLGGYYESVPRSLDKDTLSDAISSHYGLSLLHRRKGAFHKISSVLPGTWTLVLTGPRAHKGERGHDTTWGFLFPDATYFDQVTYHRALAYYLWMEDPRNNGAPRCPEVLVPKTVMENDCVRMLHRYPPRNEAL